MTKLKVMFLILIFQDILLANPFYSKMDNGERDSFFNGFFYTDSHHPVSSVYTRNDNKYIVSGTIDGYIQLWNIKTKTLIKSFKAHDEYISSISLTKDNKYIISSSSRGHIKLWNIQDGNLSKEMKFEFSGKQTLVNYQKNQIITSKNSNIEIWDIEVQKKIHTEKLKSYISSMSLSQDSKYISIITKDNVLFYDIEKKYFLKSLKYNYGYFRTHAIDMNNYNMILVKERSIDFINLRTGKEYRESIIRPIVHGITSVSLNKNGFATFGKDNGDIIIIDTNKDYDIKSIVPNHNQESVSNNFITSFIFSQKQNFLITENIKHYYTIWDISNNTPILRYKVNDVNLIIESEDKRYLIVLRQHNIIDIIDIQKKTIVKTIKYQDIIYSLSISQDNRQLLLNLNSTSTLLDIKTEKEVNSFPNNKIIFPTALIEKKEKDYKLLQGKRGTVYLYNKITKRKEKIIVVIGHNWVIFDFINKKIFHKNDGTFLFRKNKYGFFKPLIPKGLSKKNSYKLKIDNNLSLNVLNDSYTKFDLNITNISDINNTAYWIKTSKFDKYYTIREERIHKLEKGESKNLKLEVYARLPYINPKPIKDHNLTLSINTANGSEFNTTIPISIRYANIIVKDITLIEDLEDDKSILNIKLQNIGNEKLLKAKVFLLKPFKSNIQELSALDDNVTLSFVIPNKIIIESNTTVDLVVKTDSDIAPGEWHIDNVTIVLNKVEWYLYALMAFGIAILSWLIWYFKRYKNPLVVKLSENPSELLTLNTEQLKEAQERLTKIDRFKNILSENSITKERYENAIAFENLTHKERANYFAKRIFATTKQLTKQSYMLKLSDDFPLNVKQFILFVSDQESMADMMGEIKQIPQYSKNIIFILSHNSTQQAKIANEKGYEKFVRVQPPTMTKLLLAEDGAKVLADSFAEQLALTQISPYNLGGGESNASMFFGRREIISHVVGRGNNNYIVIGSRQIGKSSLMKAIEREYLKNQERVHYILVGKGNFVRAMGRALGVKVSSLEELVAYISSQAEKVLFLLDEVDPFIKNEKESGYKVLDSFRKLSEEGSCNFILAGYWELYFYTMFDNQSPLKNFGEAIELGALEAEACYEMITEPMSQLGLSFESDEAINEIIERTGQRPNLIAIICNNIIKSLGKEKRVISIADVQEAIKGKKVYELFESWKKLDEDEEASKLDKIIVYSMVEQGSFRLKELVEKLKALGLSVEMSQLETSLARLKVSYTIERNEEGVYGFMLPLFREYLLRDDYEVKLVGEVEGY